METNSYISLPYSKIKEGSPRFFTILMISQIFLRISKNSIDMFMFDRVLGFSERNESNQMNACLGGTKLGICVFLDFISIRSACSKLQHQQHSISSNIHRY